MASYAAILATVTLWAFQVPALNTLGQRWDPVSLNLGRYAVAALAFWLLLRIWGPGTAPAPGMALGLRIGALFAGFAILFTTGAIIGDPVAVVTAAAVMPLTASLVTWAVTGTPPDRALLGALVLVVPGAVLATPLAVAGGGQPVLGLVLILTAQVAWSVYSQCLPRWLPAHDQLARTRLSVLWSLPYHGAAAAAVLMAGIVRADWTTAPALDGALILATTLGPLVLGVVLWNTSVARLGLPICALFLNLVPVIGVGLAAAFGTRPGWGQLAGVALVITGMGVAQLSRRGTVQGRPTAPRV